MGDYHLRICLPEIKEIKKASYPEAANDNDYYDNHESETA